MSSELKLKLVYDSTDAERAAKDLPDAVDRQNRRSRRSFEGRGGGDMGPGDYRRMAGTASEIDRQIKAEEEAKVKAAQEAADAAAAAKDKEDKDTEAWHRKDLSRKLKEAEEAEKAAAREEAARKKEEAAAAAAAERQSKKDEDARKKEEQETEDWNRSELRRKLKELDNQRKAEEKAAKEREKAAEDAANAKDWQDVFIGRVSSGLMSGVLVGGVLSIIKGIMGGFKDSVASGLARGQVGGASAAAYGTQAKDMFQSYLLLKNVSDMSEEESNKITERLASMAQDISTGVSGQGNVAFRYFGIDPMKYKDQDFLFGEVLANMSDKYAKSGQTAQFQQMMTELLGDDWKKLRPALAAGRRVIETGTAITLESGPASTPTTAGLSAVNTRRLMVGQGPLSNIRGGNVGASGMPSMPFATSLQAMGGGDVLSAINRGPMDSIVKATEETAENTRVMSTKDAKMSGPYMVTIGSVRAK